MRTKSDDRCPLVVATQIAFAFVLRCKQILSPFEKVSCSTWLADARRERVASAWTTVAGGVGVLPAIGEGRAKSQAGSLCHFVVPTRMSQKGIGPAYGGRERT